MEFACDGFNGIFHDVLMNLLFPASFRKASRNFRDPRLFTHACSDGYALPCSKDRSDAFTSMIMIQLDKCITHLRVRFGICRAPLAFLPPWHDSSLLDLKGNGFSVMARGTGASTHEYNLSIDCQLACLIGRSLAHWYTGLLTCSVIGLPACSLPGLLPCLISRHFSELSSLV